MGASICPPKREDDVSKDRGPCLNGTKRICEFSFFNDDDNGVPPGCGHRFCPLHLDFFINHLSLAKGFGRCGFAFFDIHRRFWFGFVSWVTVFAFILSIWGCLALTTNVTVVQRSYWIGAHVTDNTNNVHYSMYVGLRSFEYVDCSFVPGYETYGSGCTRSSILFTDDACNNGPMAEACQACESAAKTMWTTAFFGCTGLILSWLGTQTRIRPIADSPVQKLMGVFSELMGILSTSVAMFTFNNTCKINLQKAIEDSNFSGHYNLGPGYICFILVTCSAIARFAVNSLVPLPASYFEMEISPSFSIEAPDQMKNLDMMEGQSADSIPPPVDNVPVFPPTPKLPEQQMPPMTSVPTNAIIPATLTNKPQVLPFAPPQVFSPPPGVVGIVTQSNKQTTDNSAPSWESGQRQGQTQGQGLLGPGLIQGQELGQTQGGGVSGRGQPGEATASSF